MRYWFWLVAVCCPLFAWSAAPPSSKPVRTEPHRSPMDVAVLPGGRYALTANHTADSASLIDLTAGKVLVEQPCGRKPSAVACSVDGKRAAVSNLWSDTLTLLEVSGTSLRSLGEVRVGHMPRGLVFAPDGRSLYVALSGADEVVQVDWQTRKTLRRWPAAQEPRRLVLTRDGQFLLAGCARSCQVRCWDTRTGKETWERTVNDSFNLLGLGLSPDGQHVVTGQVRHRHHAFVPANIEQGWAVDNRLGQFKVKAGDDNCEQIALDVRGRAVGDPSAVAFSPKGDWLVVAAPGTQELLRIRRNSIPWNSGEPHDFIDSSLELDEGKFRRFHLGGRPLSLAFLEDTDRVAVANYLLDAVQVVDVREGKVLTTVALGGPAVPSLARRGEAIFYDARRSRHHWFSCHTCHLDGHTSGRRFDTLNDDSPGNAKLTPTLRGVTRTGPWTWHGWQESLEASVVKSLTETLWGPKPKPDDVKAVMAFLETLDHPPNPHLKPDGTLSEAAERGKELFHGKARCDRCHQPDYSYTARKNFDVKLPPDGSSYDKWNPPSLRGVYSRGPYMHDASARTLDEVLRGVHAPEKLGAKELTPEERRDLIEFLKSL